MSEFIFPKGINYSCENEISAIELSNILCQTASFIQRLEPYEKLERYDDWFEHDGLHFHQKSLSFDDFFRIITSPKSLFEEMSGDDCVFVGIAPTNKSWYLRFYLEWDENDENLIGRFDITFPDKIAENYEIEVLRQSNVKMKKEFAERYFQSITV
jgi:hypothetical protein